MSFAHAARRLTILLMMLFLASIAAAYADDFEDEIDMGKKGAAEVAKQYKFVTDEKLAKRIEMIGGGLAKVALDREVPASYGNSKIAPFTYKFQVIDDKDVNAFALPGGFVYVNKGLLDYVQSDDELAGVIAHEVAHASHHHIMRLVKEQNKQMLTMAIAILAGYALGGGQTAGELAYGANLVTIAKMSAYGQQAEKDADITAVEYMSFAKYNPVGMLTFMERLARDEIRKPYIDWGIFRTHPPSYERAKTISQQIEKNGIKVNRRLITSYLKVTLKPDDENNPKSVQILVAEMPIIKLADSGGEKAQARAEGMAKRIDAAFLAGAQMRDIRMGITGKFVKIKDEIIIEPTQDDADLAGTTIQKVAADAARSLRKVLWQEQLDSSY
jgi:Zn-dependent protease with chaperone function